MAFELKEEGFKLKDILLVVGIPEATYHYHVKNFGKEDKDTELKELISNKFKEFHERYGYKCFLQAKSAEDCSEKYKGLQLSN